MSAASTATPTVVRSSSRRQSSYTAGLPERPHRTPSTTSRPPTTAASPPLARSESQTHSTARPLSASQQAALSNVARRDHETTNVARPPSSRRNSSRDGASYVPQPPKRTESIRESRRTSTRPSSHAREDAHGAAVLDAAPPVQTPAGAKQSEVAMQGTVGAKKRTTIDAQTGKWALGKTIGQGSMGKVKLAKNVETGEQVAVKIVPRQSTDEHQNSKDRERADASKEIRTAREAAIVTLLNHPYICGMRDVIRTNYHWYMLFEYVNGGQMLDYIISHGRLKEKQVRKFGRQIASALDYCHRNSIVHRDLKIENILISKTGDIKIIDFGLSNLFSPKNHLKTFCGSLYFAAPELLQARQYTGPEVDIWSFGIVLYVLVCGKVPFDDQSMPQLHAKIKKGVVDYPSWLSPECKNLISRMLVTDPKARAPLSDIINHPWMTKGFNTPPENYLPHREPIQLPLDQSVITKMQGFDFGDAGFITRKMTEVVGSEEYQNAVRLNAREQALQGQANERKRGVFDFYKRRNSISSRDTLPSASTDALQLGSDPVNAFSPYLSIYYLAREKQERERQEANPGALSLPMSPGEKPLTLIDLPAPPAAYTNSTPYEMPGEKPTGGRSRARSRTHGEDDVTEGMKKASLNVPGSQAPPAIVTPPLEQAPLRKESATAGLLRRFSTRRNRESPREKSESQAASAQPQQAQQDAPNTLRKSFSVRRNREKAPPPSPMTQQAGNASYQQDFLAPNTAEGTTKRHSSILDRSTSVASADRRKRYSRRGFSEVPAASTPPEPPLTSGSDRSSISGKLSKTSEPAPSELRPNVNSRAPTSRTRSLGHARRQSMHARRSRRLDAREANVPEETDQDLADEDAQHRRHDSFEGGMKPVYLKGLFSVSTTSSKPLAVIRSDIIRVLRQLGVDFDEIKGGFSCRHAPSIDLNRVQDVEGGANADYGVGNPPSSQNKRRISFAGFNRGEKESPLDQDTRSPQIHRKSTRRKAAPPDASFTNSEGSEESITQQRRGGGADPERAPGETSTHVQSELGNNMVLLFEIFVVKVPLFSLHGIQFKKVQGGTWQYKSMAQRILDNLRL